MKKFKKRIKRLNLFFKKKKKPELAISLIYLIAALSKANNGLNEKCIAYAKLFYNKIFAKEAVNKAFSILNELNGEEIKIDIAIIKIKNRTNYALRLKILRFLFSYAYINSKINKQQKKILNRTAYFSGIRTFEYIELTKKYFDK